MQERQPLAGRFVRGVGSNYMCDLKVGDKVTESVNNLDGEKISREVQGAVNGVVNEVNRVAETVNRKFNTNARTNYQSPQGQNPDGTYHYSYTQTAYSNYKRPNTNPNQAPSSAPGGPYNPPRGTAPRNTVSQNGAPVQQPKKAPRKQDMIEKYNENLAKLDEVSEETDTSL